MRCGEEGNSSRKKSALYTFAKKPWVRMFFYVGAMSAKSDGSKYAHGIRPYAAILRRLDVIFHARASTLCLSFFS